MLSDSLQQATLHITEKMEQIEPALYARLVRGELAEIAGNNRELQQICRIFSQGFCDQGFWIEEQQLMSLERASEQLQERLKVLEYKMIEKNRMIVWISLLSGGFICIVLA